MYLIHDHFKSVFRAVLSPYFNEIYLMPESPVLADVTTTLKRHLEGPKRWQLVHTRFFFAPLLLVHV